MSPQVSYLRRVLYVYVYVCVCNKLYLANKIQMQVLLMPETCCDRYEDIARADKIGRWRGVHSNAQMFFSAWTISRFMFCSYVDQLFLHCCFSLRVRAGSMWRQSQTCLFGQCLWVGGTGCGLWPMMALCGTGLASHLLNLTVSLFTYLFQLSILASLNCFASCVCVCEPA
jgi:hypothetical protein